MTATRHGEKPVHGLVLQKLGQVQVNVQQERRQKGETGKVNAGEDSDIKS